MTDLTEQLAKERLPRGWYYILDKENTPFQAYSFGDGTFYHNIKPREILGLVPSYDEWKALNQKLNHVLKTQARQFVDNQKLQVKAEKAKDVVNLDTERQIKQLKELLKDSVYILNEYKHCFEVKHYNMTANIVEKTNEVLK